jgi:hypothetical protein
MYSILTDYTCEFYLAFTITFEFIYRMVTTTADAIIKEVRRITHSSRYVGLGGGII